MLPSTTRECQTKGRRMVTLAKSKFFFFRHCCRGFVTQFVLSDSGIGGNRLRGREPERERVAELQNFKRMRMILVCSVSISHIIDYSVSTYKFFFWQVFFNKNGCRYSKHCGLALFLPSFFFAQTHQHKFCNIQSK